MIEETDVVAQVVEETGERLLKGAQGRVPDKEITFARNLLKAVTRSIRDARDDWEEAKAVVAADLQIIQDRLDQNTH